MMANDEYWIKEWQHALKEKTFAEIALEEIKREADKHSIDPHITHIHRIANRALAKLRELAASGHEERPGGDAYPQPGYDKCSVCGVVYKPGDVVISLSGDLYAHQRCSK